MKREPMKKGFIGWLSCLEKSCCNDKYNTVRFEEHQTAKGALQTSLIPIFDEFQWMFMANILTLTKQLYCSVKTHCNNVTINMGAKRTMQRVSS